MGAPLLNDNAVKHGINLWLARGEFPSGHEAVAEQLETLIGQLIQDKGGIENLTGAEMILIDNIKKAQGVVLLGFAWLNKTGYIKKLRDGDYDFRAPLKTLGVYMNVVRFNLQLLGLDRRARQVDDLEAMLNETR